MKNVFKINFVEKELTKNWEYLIVEVKFDKSIFLVIVMYRIPSGSTSLFIDKISELLSTYYPKYPECILLGDFNIPMNRSSPTAWSLFSLFNEFNLANFVNVPTITSGNILDLIVLDMDREVEVKVQTSASDHLFVFFQFTVETQKSLITEHFDYGWKNVNHAVFADHLFTKFDVLLETVGPHLLSTEWEIVNKCFSAFYDSLDDTRECLANYRRSVQKYNKPRYFDDECIQSKRLKRKFERNFKKNPSTENEVRFESHLVSYYDLLCKKRSEYLTSRLNSDKSRIRFMTFDQIFKRKEKILPDSTDHTKLANDFNSFFVDKVEKVRSSIDSHLVLVLLDKSFNHWKSFQTVTSEETESIVTKVSNSTSPNDFAPAVFFKYFATKYSSLCSDMVNCILQSGVFPNELKRGIIVPLYKTGD